VKNVALEEFPAPYSLKLIMKDKSETIVYDFTPSNEILWDEVEEVKIEPARKIELRCRFPNQSERGATLKSDLKIKDIPDWYDLPKRRWMCDTRTYYDARIRTETNDWVDLDSEKTLEEANVTDGAFLLFRKRSVMKTNEIDPTKPITILCFSESIDNPPKEIQCLRQTTLREVRSRYCREFNHEKHSYHFEIFQVNSSGKGDKLDRHEKAELLKNQLVLFGENSEVRGIRVKVHLGSMQGFFEELDLDNGTLIREIPEIFNERSLRKANGLDVFLGDSGQPLRLDAQINDYPHLEQGIVLKERPKVTVWVFRDRHGKSIARDFYCTDQVDVICKSFEWDGDRLFFEIDGEKETPISPTQTFGTLREPRRILVEIPTPPKEEEDVVADENSSLVWECPPNDLKRIQDKIKLIREAQGPSVIRLLSDPTETTSDEKIEIKIETETLKMKPIDLQAEFDTHEALCKIAEAILRLHSKKILLNTLIREDIGLNEQREPVIYRFTNISKWFSKEEVEEFDLENEPPTCAPEVSRDPDFPVDVWSFGVLICEFVTRRQVEREMLPRRGKTLKIDGFPNPLYKTLVVQCLDREPENRPKLEDVLKTLRSPEFRVSVQKEDTTE
jgi:hypothetical protein